MSYIYVVSRSDMVLNATPSMTLCIEFACEQLMINQDPQDYSSFVKELRTKLRKLTASKFDDCGSFIHSHPNGVSLKFTAFRQG